MTLEDQAARLSKPDLIRLLNAVYGVESHVDDIIDRYLAAGEGPGNESAALTDTLSAQLKQISDEDEFFGYRGCYDFSERLSSILSAIDNLLRPQDPQAALNLTEMFLELADEAFQQVDDSDGYVGSIFRDATNQWLAIAVELRQQKPDAENWPAKLLTFFDKNDYGVLDDIISNSAAVQPMPGNACIRDSTSMRSRFTDDSNRSTRKIRSARNTDRPCTAGTSAIATTVKSNTFQPLRKNPVPRPMSLSAISTIKIARQTLSRSRCREGRRRRRPWHPRGCSG